MSPRFPIFASSSEARTATLQGLLIAAIVITGLYVAREVLLPLALAILLSFVLTPALLLLRRLKVPRIIGVAIVVAFAFAVIFALGWLLSQQATQLAQDLPRYQDVLAEKISALRNSAAGSPALEKATEAVKGLERELANNRRYRHSLCDLHPLAARGFAGQGDPPARRLGLAARYLRDERRRRATQQVFP
jgi:predicted PurR-regulated permease PerM